MYKVFIDHKPLIFVDKDNFKKGEGDSVKYKNLPVSKVKLRHLMKETTIESPLYVRCKDVELAFKEYFKPYRKVTAGGGIVKRKNKYLVIKRNGRWDIPKGKIEKGEAIAEGSIREIEEECGIEGPTIEKFLTKTYHLFNYRRNKAIKTTHWYLMNYSGPKETTPQENEGITKAKWMSYEDMLSIRGETYGSINELLDVFEAQNDC